MEQIVRTPDQLGAALRRQRRKRGVSQALLAERTGLRQATVSTVEAGQARFSTVCALLAALDLELLLRPRTTAPLDAVDDLL